MTNEEKFIEVFGVEPETDQLILKCPPKASMKCKYHDDLDDYCHCDRWWQDEFTDNAIKIEEIEKAWESISDVSEGGYVDIEEVKLWFAKWLGKDEDEL